MTEALEGTRKPYDTYPIRVDTRGRIATPPTYKETFRDGVVISPGLGNRCLLIMNLTRWRETMEGLVEEMLSKRLLGRNRIERLLYGRTYDNQLDSQGRLLLRPSHRTYADLSINSRGVIVGVDSHLEAWSLTEWVKHTNKINDSVREDRI